VREEGEMDHAQFWRLIEAAKAEARGDTDAQLAVLTKKLAALPAEEIVQFDGIFHEMMALSYRWDLWGAAYVLNGGCSDDGFDYFRGWLIAQGESVFRKALEDPESLADVATPEVECEEMFYVAASAYQAKTGDHSMPAPRVSTPSEPVGKPWDEETVGEMYPRLAALWTDTSD
jgi:hypothetical protein